MSEKEKVMFDCGEMRPLPEPQCVSPCAQLSIPIRAFRTVLAISVSVCWNGRKNLKQAPDRGYLSSCQSAEYRLAGLASSTIDS